MKLELTQKLEQQQILAPQMILSMDILLLAAAELENRIEKELAENPALEVAEPEPQAAPRQETAEPGPATETDDKLFEKLESIQGQHSYYENRTPRGDPDHDKHEMLQNTEGKPPGLREMLTQQLHLLAVKGEVQAIGEEIIQNLDHRGYLLAPEEEVFRSLEGKHSRESFDAALNAVRSLEPAGVGAQDLRHCLLLQLERDQQAYPVETQIILHHLDDLSQNKIPKIAKELGKTVDEIKEAVEIITALDPLPGSRYEDEPTFYIRADIIVEKIEGKWQVRVDEGSVPQLTISESCRQILKQSRKDPRVSGFLRKKIEAAQWLIQAIRQRQRTLYDIAVAIVAYQQDFMEHGPTHLRAMKMQTIADIVHVHISTISRAIKGKYVQTPWGTFELRFFFTGGVTKSDGELESRRNIYRQIGEIIEKEDKSHPYSDCQIARILREKGLDIARRTVTKYRVEEKIPCSRVRKAY